MSPFPAHFLDREAAVFTRDLGVHHHLQKKVAQFLAQIGVVIRPDRVGHFIGFLEQARDERFVRLLAIPGTTAGGAQLRDNVAQSREVIRHS